MDWTFAKTIEIINWGRTHGVYPGAALSTGDAGGELFRMHCGYSSFYPRPEEMRADTLFDVASLTKIMSTAMVALKFIEEKRLNLSDPLDYFFDTPADKKGVTIWHLMTHTSGLPAHVDLWRIPFSGPERVSDDILKQPLLYDTGKDVTYSCLGFILLGKICEKLGGAGLGHLADDMVFKPLGMKNTGYNPINTKNIVSTEYSFEEGRYICGEVHDENARYIGGVSGNAGIFSTIGDCAVFAQMLASKGSHDGKEFINRDLFLESIKNHTIGLSEGRGLGFVVKAGLPSSSGNVFPDGSYGHTGFTGTSIWIDIETTQYLALLTNRVHPTRENEAMIRHRKEIHDVCATDYR
ncbi:MAG: beta-lactamase family protein [Defluviitaleaceae bacterium]|nr:beta-lactamase family protein [Defluviitaleaceae bacterium]MCL2835582.1 beta-lactamase family protein [Defluviitaleaceae bacterium]